ncbi:MAG: type VI secretion system ATPase TssH, partial [Proteiniphilum sp.]|nr:type VI secretion system ATPase TssH [Proteiniphilum sp.]
MNFNNFTIKAQESVQESIDLARTNNQQIIEPTHLLKGLTIVGEDIVNFLFQKMGVNVTQLQLNIDKDIESFPKVSGGEPTLSRELNSVFQKANDIASKMQDQFVSIEHLLLAIIYEKNSAS